MQARTAIISIMAASLCLAGCTSEAATGTAEASTTDVIAESSVVDLSVQELVALQADGNIRLIDVRRDDEVAEGVIPGAEHIALGNFDPANLDLSDGREVVLYCRSGRRSGIAGERLAEHTGETAKHLAGGIIAWRKAEQPVVIP